MPQVEMEFKRTGTRLPRASWHAVANAVVLVWLGLTAVAVVARDHLPAPQWLLIHVFVLGAVTNAIVTWTEHFSHALLRMPAPPRQWPLARLVLLNVAIVAVLYGTSGGHAWLAVAGAALLLAVVCAHFTVMALRSRNALGGRFRHVLTWYVWAGVALLAGGTLGGWMASGHVPARWHARIEAAHIHVNILGWVGLTVLGTLFTLWPTVLRTQIAESTAKIARLSLRLAVPGLAVAVTGLSADLRWVAAAGLALFTAGAVLSLQPFVTTFRRRRPHNAASWTLAAGTGWLVAALIADLVIVATHPPGEVAEKTEAYVPVALAGFIGQVLLGSLLFLLPVVLGGGPAALKRNAALLERFWIVRLAAVNIAVPLVAAPVPGWPRTLAWAVLLAALAAFVLPALIAVGRSLGVRPPAAGIAVGALLTAAAVVFAASGTSAPSSVTVTGGRTVDVTLAGMRILPGTISVAPGTRLTLRVTNKDAQRHDLRLGTGQATPMLAPGKTATITVTVAESIDGWCTVPGHRAAGMTMRIETKAVASGGGGRSGGHSGHASTPGTDHHDMPGPLNLAAPPSPGWKPYDATLKPAPGGEEHRLELHAVEKELEVAPGVKQTMWTFGGTVPAPTLRGKVGDVFTITFVNDGGMGHGVDFHAGSLAPDVPMRTIQPGERLTYRFKAARAGAWLYHCSTMPMTQHIANGMYGAVVVDPPDLPRADREYILVQGELYLGGPDDAARITKINEGRPDGWMFNGTAAGYDHAQLKARVGERVRVWVVAAGPDTGTAFHIVGAQFDTVYKEGAYLLRPDDDGGAQVLDLAPAQGGFVETVFPEPGHYPFVDHAMRRAETGAHGIFEVSK
ncbi:multicopper oxidase domain-containing protein [Spirillospora albida]|uniref:multicopper oxidase domain-containing protein n=1 Tax=Spirillospora albida TaxID=58123 RepID=UPI000562F06E|nr:multicopper oxidase domain-containing protein [Spirillospora albida]